MRRAPSRGASGLPETSRQIGVVTASRTRRRVCLWRAGMGPKCSVADHVADVHMRGDMRAAHVRVAEVEEYRAPNRRALEEHERLIAAIIAGANREALTYLAGPLLPKIAW